MRVRWKTPAGFGIGGEYGEAKLQIRGRPTGYHNIAAAR
jgi:hypothetical protein